MYVQKIFLRPKKLQFPMEDSNRGSLIFGKKYCVLCTINCMYEKYFWDPPPKKKLQFPMEDSNRGSLIFGKKILCLMSSKTVCVERRASRHILVVFSTTINKCMKILKIVL
jgi:hypothetical protein